jgi:ribosomal protein S19E (S16A)
VAEPNSFDLIGQEMLDYAEGYDKALSTGGKIAHEESEKEQAAAPPADDPPKTEGSTPVETATAPAPADDPWGQLAQAAGKWKDGEEAKKGYFHALNLAKSALAERDALKAQLGQPPSPRAEMPAQREEQRDAIKQLEDYGVPSEVIGRAIDERARATLMEILTPMATQMQAETYMADKYGDQWSKNKPEVELFIQSDPILNAQVNAARAKGEFSIANEFAFLRYKDDRGARTEEALKANDEVRKEIVDQARKDAGIVGSKRAEGRDSDKKAEGGVTAARFEKMKENARAGYSNELWRETIGRSLPDEMFNGSL